MTGTYERQLVTALGHESLPDRGPGARRAAMRCPSSGSATTRSLPDVLAGLRIGVVNPAPDNLSNPWAIELKCGRAKTLYVTEQEVADLREFADRFGARALLGAKFKRPGARSPFYLLDPEDCRMTDSGNYGIPATDAGERAYAMVYTATDAEPARIRIPSMELDEADLDPDDTDGGDR